MNFWNSHIARENKLSLFTTPHPPCSVTEQVCMVCLGGMTARCSQAILLGLGSHAKQIQDLLFVISNIMGGLQASIQPIPSAKFPRIPYFFK